jgi:hypothetical protein
MTEGNFKCGSSRLCCILGGIAALLVVWGSFLHFARIWTGNTRFVTAIKLFGLNEENSLPSTYSSMLLFTAALLLAWVALCQFEEQLVLKRGWWILCAGFVLMAVDETASVHELVNLWVFKLLALKQYGIFYYSWVIPAILLIAALLVYFIPFLRALPRETARRFVVSGSVFLSGAVGVEMAGGSVHENSGQDNTIYALLVALEEGMEMSGVVLFIRAILLHLRSEKMALRLTISE